MITKNQEHAVGKTNNKTTRKYNFLSIKNLPNKPMIIFLLSEVSLFQFQVRFVTYYSRTRTQADLSYALCMLEQDLQTKVLNTKHTCSTILQWLIYSMLDNCGIINTPNRFLQFSIEFSIRSLRLQCLRRKLHSSKSYLQLQCHVYHWYDDE